jgi:hypothetical protein
MILLPDIFNDYKYAVFHLTVGKKKVRDDGCVDVKVSDGKYFKCRETADEHMNNNPNMLMLDLASVTQE